MSIHGVSPHRTFISRNTTNSNSNSDDADNLFNIDKLSGVARQSSNDGGSHRQDYFSKTTAASVYNQQLAKALALKDNFYHGAEFALRSKEVAKNQSRSKNGLNQLEGDESEDGSILLSESHEVLSSAYRNKFNFEQFIEQFADYLPLDGIKQLTDKLVLKQVIDIQSIEQFIAGSCSSIFQKYLSLVYIYNNILTNMPNSSAQLIALETMIEEVEVKKSGYLFNCFNFTRKKSNKIQKSSTGQESKLIDFLANCNTFEVNITPDQFTVAIEAIGNLLDDDFEKMKGIYAKYAMSLSESDKEGSYSENDISLPNDMNFMKTMFMLQSMYYDTKELLTDLNSDFSEVNKTNLLKRLATLPEGLVTMQSLQLLYGLCKIGKVSSENFALFVKNLYPYFKNSSLFLSNIRIQAKDKLLFDLMAMRNTLDAKDKPSSKLNLTSHIREYVKYV